MTNGDPESRDVSVGVDALGEQAIRKKLGGIWLNEDLRVGVLPGAPEQPNGGGMS
jgi:hypothetical protein